MLVQSGPYYFEMCVDNAQVVTVGQEGVGNIAINDSFMLEGAIYFLLKKHFRKEPYYVDLLELFHDVGERTGFSAHR